MFHYSEKLLNHRLTDNHYQIFGKQLNKKNQQISFITGITRPFSPLAVDDLVDMNFISPAAGGTYCLPLYRYTSTGERIDNITDWGLQQFQNKYELNEPSSPVCYANSSEIREELKIDVPDTNRITKEDIFHYTYAVLHNPAYRKKYELNLKREFPRIPFYDNFFQWRDWGKQLMNLHINYESVQPYPLQQKEVNTKEQPKAKLRAFLENFGWLRTKRCSGGAI